MLACKVNLLRDYSNGKLIINTGEWAKWGWEVEISLGLNVTELNALMAECFE